jgi:hypothetical protein
VRVLAGTQPSVNDVDLRVVQARLRVLQVALSSVLTLLLGAGCQQLGVL